MSNPNTTTEHSILRRGLAALIAFLLAAASIVGFSQSAAAATPGLQTTLLLNGAPLGSGTSHDGVPVIEEGAVLTLRVQYSQSEGLPPGAVVEFDLGGDLAGFGPPPAGNEMVESFVGDGSRLIVTFKDPLPADVNQGFFDLNIDIASVDESTRGQIRLSIDGEDQSVEVIVRNNGDQFENVAESFDKSRTAPGNLDSYVTHTKDDDGNVTVEVLPAIADQWVTYTLRVSSPESREDFTIEDVLDASMRYDEDSFTAALTTWDEDGLNRETDSFAFTPTITGSSFSWTGNIEGPSVLDVTYRAKVDASQIADLRSRLQAQANTLKTDDSWHGWYQVLLQNTADFGGITQRSATVRLGDSIPQPPNPNPGPTGADLDAAFQKGAAWSSAIVEVDDEGGLTPPVELTYTLRANLAWWDGRDGTSGTQNPNRVLDRNVVIQDILPPQASWITGTGFITASDGFALTEAATCPPAADFEADPFVGTYCVDGQRLLINVGKETSTDVTFHVAAQLNSIDGLADGSTSIVDASAHIWPNTATFYYDGGSHNRSRSVTVVVLPEGGNGIDDSSVFTKRGTGQTRIEPGESVTVAYTFTVEPGIGIDAREATIVDHVDATVFDLRDPATVAVTGTYDGQALDASHFEVAISEEDDLLITLSDAGDAVVATRGADKRLQVFVALTSREFIGKETIDIINRATLHAEGLEHDYTSWTAAEVTSYGNEAEVRKRLFDPAGDPANPWTETLSAYVDAEGALVQDTYVYRVEFIGRGTFGGVGIIPVIDDLPGAVEFLGFVEEADVPEFSSASLSPTGPVEVGANLVAAYDEDLHRVTMSQKPGTTFPAGERAAAYFAVKVTYPDDVETPIVNAITGTRAVIDPQEKPSIDIEKWTDEGPASGPVYDDAGNLLNDGYSGDFDAAPKALPVPEAQELRFTISNDGGEPLTDVVVSDELTGGEGAIEDLECVFPDGRTGTEWDGVLEPGVQFECTGTLPALPAGATHQDTASVIGVGVHSGDVVDDEDEWNAYTKSYAVGDYVWIDTNRNGQQDDDELPLAGVIVELLQDGVVIDDTTTDANGRYAFDELEAGVYQVRFTLTEAQQRIYEFTSRDSGSDDARDSDADRSTGFTIEIVLDDSNTALTGDYDHREIRATEGIDPTWDAGVVVKPAEHPVTGGGLPLGYLWAALLLLGLGGGMLLLNRSRTERAPADIG